jgi:O-methyltransferase domain
MPDNTALRQPEAAPLSAQILEMSYTALVVYRAVYVATKLGIPDILKDKALSSDELAKATSTHPRALYRLLRALSNAGIVSESLDHRFALTPLGNLLRSEVPGSMRALVIFTGEPFYLQAWQEFLYSIQTGKPAWDKVHGLPIFDYLRQHPEASTIFDEAMTSVSEGEALAVAAAYDFSRFRILVDIGGGQGKLLTTLLKANSSFRGVLFDQPEVVEAAREGIASAGLTDRCEIVAGDFFQSVPPGGDVYLLKYIIHDWDEERSGRILENCRQVMTKDATLLIVDPVIAPPGQPHYAKFEDLEMLALAGGADRTAEEYSTLLDRAQFKLARVVNTQAYLSIIEAIPV